MNTGETGITTDPFTGLAPITRIGGGEVRADRAFGAPAAAWDEETLQGGLSFGFVEVDKDTVNLQRTVIVRNYTDQTLEYEVTPTFRYQEDADSGAVSVDVPSGKVRVRAGGTAKVQVHMRIEGNLLNGNFMNSGSNGADPAALTANEFDGYLVFARGGPPGRQAQEWQRVGESREHRRGHGPDRRLQPDRRERKSAAGRAG